MRSVFFRYTLFGAVTIQHVLEEDGRVLLTIEGLCVQDYRFRPRQGASLSSCICLTRQLTAVPRLGVPL